jgi:hypothetical protein
MGAVLPCEQHYLGRGEHSATCSPLLGREILRCLECAECGAGPACFNAAAARAVSLTPSHRLIISPFIICLGGRLAAGGPVPRLNQIGWVAALAMACRSGERARGAPTRLAHRARRVSLREGQ